MRMRAYGDSSLVITAGVKNVFEISKHQGAYEMDDVVDVGKDSERPGEYRVRIAWFGLEDEEPTWEPVSTMYENAPKYLE